MWFRTQEDMELFLLLEGEEGQSLDEARDSYFDRKSVFWNSTKELRRALQQKHNWRKYRAKYELGIRRFFHSYKGLSVRRYLQRSLRQELIQGKTTPTISESGFSRQELLLYLNKFSQDFLQESLAYQSDSDVLQESWEITNRVVLALSELTHYIIHEGESLSEDTQALLLLLLEDFEDEDSDGA